MGHDMENCDNSPDVLRRGAAVIREAVRTLSDGPGVYRMLDERGNTLYVGKAKSLKKRVVSYAHVNRLPVRLQRMVARTCGLEFVTTHTETEALLLESNLIKKLKPYYNILLRDDKSFPYILLSATHEFPTVVKHRGNKKIKGEYFGPFASAGDVNRTIEILQRIFMLRNCSDGYFAARTRPCLQYHIKRCTAPCVGLVSREEYARQVAQAKDFLHGKSRAVQESFAAEMEKASAEMRYEEAALYRDRIAALNAVQAHQDINLAGLGDCDVFAFAGGAQGSCVQVFFFRGGRNLGNRAYFPRHDAAELPADILSSFIAQFYENKPAPRLILVSEVPAEQGLLELALSERMGRKVELSSPSRGRGRRALDFAVRNVQGALERHLAAKAGDANNLKAVAKLFELDDPPARIEIYDNSHISGTNMVGGMVVAGPDGFIKKAYRKFNIREAAKSDDYGMMREVMRRRFTRALREGGETDWPDLLLIDGGLGQYNAVCEVLEELGVLNRLCVVAIAKGEDRNAGRETFFMEGNKPFQLPVNDPVLHYLQRLRDEAHRFAVGAHRTRRAAQISGSPLDDVPGVGAARKKALLRHFGSAKAVAGAGVEDLMLVEGVSRSLARKIYEHFH